jgi:DNA-binding MarR family transcriptional regulator
VTLEPTAPAKPAGARRRRLGHEIRESLRELSTQLALFNHQVVTHLDFNDVDLTCLELLNRHGPLSPGELARRAGLHPATITGVLDRLERGHWVARERDPADRRGVLVRALRDRGTEIFHLYSGMNARMDDVCAGYTEAELRLIVGFLAATTEAGRQATARLADG